MTNNTSQTLTIADLQMGFEVLCKNGKTELPEEQTIGEPSNPMSYFERIMRHSWRSHGGIGNPPKVFISEELSEDMKKLGCPDHLMTIARKL